MVGNALPGGVPGTPNLVVERLVIDKKSWRPAEMMPCCLVDNCGLMNALYTHTYTRAKLYV